MTQSMRKYENINVGIIGSAGYTGGELLRLLLNHPYVNVVFAHSKSNVGKFVWEVHTDLLGETDLVFCNEVNDDVDVMFLCLGHGESRKLLEQVNFPADVKIIDLSQDFRIDEAYNNQSFQYGLPEVCRNKIEKANYIANPGCFATGIQLGLLPAVTAKIINSDIHISGITGSSGAGQGLSETSHFSWRNNNLSTYKVFNHQHLNEVKKTFKEINSSFDSSILFVPYRGSFTRGIWTTLYFDTDLSESDARELYSQYYHESPFVHITLTQPHLKQVVNTNKCYIYLEKHENNLVVTTILDNLLKGACGQAVQNMNLMFGLNEAEGLKIKAMAF